MTVGCAVTTDGREVLVVGLTATNVRRLSAGEPINLDVDDLDHVVRDAAVGHVVIVYGRTDADVRRAIESFLESAS